MTGETTQPNGGMTAPRPSEFAEQVLHVNPAGAFIEDETTIRNVRVFSAGPVARDVDPDTGEVLSWLIHSPDEVRMMAENGQHLVATHQRVPLVHEHFGIGAVGWAEGWRYEDGDLYADWVGMLPEFVKAFSEDRLLGWSVEVIPNGASSNYKGTSGPMVKRIALLTENMPKLKHLAGDAYAEPCTPIIQMRDLRMAKTILSFSESADGGGHLIHLFRENHMPGVIPAPSPDAAVAAAAGGMTTIPVEAVMKLLEQASASDELMNAVKALAGTAAAEHEAKKKEDEIAAAEHDLEKKKDTEAAEHDPEEDRKRREEEERKKREEEEKANMSEGASDARIRVLERRLEEYSERDDKRERNQQDRRLKQTSGELIQCFGPAQAADAMIIIRSQVGGADLFSEAGEADLEKATAFATKWMRELPASERAMQRTSVNTQGGDYSEDDAEAEIFSESDATPAQLEFLRRKTAKPILDAMKNRRVRARKVAV